MKVAQDSWILIILLLKRDLRSLFTSFSLERPHVQLHSVPLHPFGPLVQSCHGEKNVTYKDLETTLQHSWYSSKVSCLSTKLLQPYLENWHECSLRFRCPLFLHFFTNEAHKISHILIVKLKFLQIMIQEARILFIGR